MDDIRDLRQTCWFFNGRPDGIAVFDTTLSVDDMKKVQTEFQAATDDEKRRSVIESYGGEWIKLKDGDQ